MYGNPGGWLSSENILVVDDEESIREVLAILLETRGYRCAMVRNGAEALRLTEAERFDLVLSDVLMPVMNGLALIEQLQKHEPELPVVIVTALHDVSTAIDALRAGAYDYILKPFEKDQLYISVGRALEHRRLVVENRNYQNGLERLVGERTAQLSRTLRDLEQSYDYTLEAFAGALDLKDSQTEGHCQRVTSYTILIARRMGIDAETLRHIARGAFLHDIGKMGIPDSILRKPGPLTAEEWRVMRQHAQIGYAVLRNIPFLGPAAEIVLAHQERYDGKGYPRGLRGDEIPLGARIFAVADAFDAMISERPYRESRSIEAACQEIRRNSGTQFDPKVVEVFLSLPVETWTQVRASPSGAFHLSVLSDSNGEGTAGAAGAGAAPAQPAPGGRRKEDGNEK